jgi:PBSX family phage terminase large subunit
MVAGLQSGKTTAGGLWMRKTLSQYHAEKDSSYIVAFPTYSIFNSSTLPAFFKYCGALGYFHKSEKTFYLNHGPKVYFRSMDNEWSCEGITKCRGIWVDEGGLISTQAFINLMGRAAPMQCNIFISTTPYNTSNYLYHDLYEPWKDGERDDVDIIQFKSVDNPYFPRDEYYRQQRLLDPRMFALRYEGRFERMAGLVYQDFDYANICDPFKIDPNKYLVVGGLDWGYADPFAVVIRALSRDGKADYQIGEYLRTGHTPDEQLEVTKRLQKEYGVTTWYADSADPGMIEYFRKNGLSITGVVKGHNSVQNGIALHQQLIRAKTYRVFRGKCPCTEEEYETYSYPPDKDGKNPITTPVKFADHLMDASRYVSMCCFDMLRAWQPVFKPSPTHLQRLIKGEYSSRPSGDDW